MTNLEHVGVAHRLAFFLRPPQLVNGPSGVMFLIFGVTMLVPRAGDVGGGRIVEQGAKAGIVVHADIALHVLEGAFFVRAFIGAVMAGRVDLLVLWRLHSFNYSRGDVKQR